MDKRIFVEKKADFRVKSDSLVKELKHNLQLKTLKDLRIVQVYDVFGLAEDLFARAEKHIFSEQVTDTVLDEAAVKADLEKYAFFAIESLPGQFDQRAASSQEALLLLGSSNDVTVNTAQLYLVNKDIDANELEAVKNYLLNPVDSRFKDITVGIAKQDFSESDKTIPSLNFFETYTAEDFAQYKAEQGLAMEVDDLLFIQDYFKSIGRVPTETELKVLDTYWSDHCRHTTFETELKNIDFSASKFQKQLQATYDKYIAMRDELGRTEKPQTLMDMATIFLVVMSVPMVVWMTWKCLMKSMPALLKLKWMSMVSKNHGFSCSRTKRTTTQRRSNHLVERQLVSVVPFVTHCQGVHTFTKPSVSQVLVILQLQSLKHALVNCHNK